MQVCDGRNLSARSLHMSYSFVAALSMNSRLHAEPNPVAKQGNSGNSQLACRIQYDVLQ